MIIAIEAVRATLLLASAWLLLLTGRSAWALFRGSQSFAQTGRAAQAFIAMACLLGQLFYLFVPEPIALLTALVFACIGVGLFIQLSRRARRKRLIKVDCLIDNPHWSLPLVELGEVDPELANIFAQQARQALADRRAQ